MVVLQLDLLSIDEEQLDKLAITINPITNENGKRELQEQGQREKVLPGIKIAELNSVLIWYSSSSIELQGDCADGIPVRLYPNNSISPSFKILDPKSKNSKTFLAIISADDLLMSLVYLSVEKQELGNLETKLSWIDNTLSLSLTVRLLPLFFSTPLTPAKKFISSSLFGRSDLRPVTVDDFYAALRPAPPTVGGLPLLENGNQMKLDETEDIKEIIGLDTKLFTYQFDIVRFLLSKEGVYIQEDGSGMESIEPLPESHLAPKSLAWENQSIPLLSNSYSPTFNQDSVKLEEGSTSLYYNHVTKQLASKLPKIGVATSMNAAVVASETGSGERGTLLASEMGLGKTLATIALILLHKEDSRNDLPPYRDENIGGLVQPTGMTLIVAPAAIVDQWSQELKRHAPSISVFLYTGVASLNKDWTPQFIAANFDVILTTFDTAKSDVNFARKPVERQLRSGFKFTYIKTVSLIPRKFSLAVTGTPISAIKDLKATFRFLRIEEFSSKEGWFSLTNDIVLFRRVIGAIGERTTKAIVNSQLALPPQERWIIKVGFTELERYYYNQRYQESLNLLGLDDNGHPSLQAVQWNANVTEMNHWVSILRRICCHPGAGAVGKKVFQKKKLGVGSLEEISDQMISKNNELIAAKSRELQALKVDRAEMISLDSENCLCFEDSIDLLNDALVHIESQINYTKTSLSDLWSKKQNPDRDTSLTLEAVIALGTEEDQAAGIVEDPALAKSIGYLRTRLRDLIKLSHRASFLLGSNYFNMGNKSDLETKSYADAENLRLLFMGPYESRINAAHARLLVALDSRELKNDPFTLKSLEIDLPDRDVKFPEELEIGFQSIWDEKIRSSKAINNYAALIWKYRTMILEILETSVSEVVEGEGDLYEQGAARQERADIIAQNIHVLIDDYRFAISGVRIAIIEDFEFMAPAGKRLSKKEKKRLRIEPTLLNGGTSADILRYSMLIEREAAKNEILDSVVPLSESLRSINAKKDDETDVSVLNEARRLKLEIALKEKKVNRLRKDAEDITTAFNSRIEYFKILQELSDSVRAPLFTRTVRVSTCLVDYARKQAASERALAELKFNQKILARINGEMAQEECCICMDSYTEGVLTSCFHHFCESCWNNVQATSKRCPLCRKILDKDDWRAFNETKEKVKHEEKENLIDGAKKMDIEEDVLEAEPDYDNSTPLELPNLLPEQILQEIDEMPSISALSSKVTMIVKHVKYIRQEDPTHKIVIFSSWIDSLEILMQAFNREGGIGYVRLETGGRKGKSSAVNKFINDPSIACFLLHTNSQAAGLNLTAASHVMLMEPLFHRSLELQAVARVHRIGQKKPTQVYQYLVEDTVDSRIALLRLKQGNSLFSPNAVAELATDEEDVENSCKELATAVTVAARGAEVDISSAGDLVSVLFQPAHAAAIERYLTSAVQFEALLE